MTMPAGPATAPCDICGAEPAHVSLMVLATYEQTRIGLACMPDFFATIAAQMTGAAPAAAPRPGEPLPAPAGPPALDEDPVTGDMVPIGAGPPAAASGPPAGGYGPPLDIVRQADAEAAQLSLLRLLGVPKPDPAECPKCGTIAHAWPGFAAWVCPYCATMFGPGWVKMLGTPDSEAPAHLVPDSEAGAALVEDTAAQETAQAEHLAAADLEAPAGAGLEAAAAAAAADPPPADPARLL